MGKKSPSAPPPPDPVATAKAQGAINKETAIAQAQINQVNQQTPYGSIEWSQRGTTSEGTPQYSALQTFSPSQQILFDLTNQAGEKYGQTANAQLDAVRAKLANPFDLSGLGAAPVANEATRTAVRDAMMARLAPEFAKRRAALETSLANQGFQVGTQGYNVGMDEYNRAYNDATLAADVAAGNQMAQMYGLESAARDKAINELVMQRTQPLSELASMMGGAAPQMPQFANTPITQIQTPDLMGATYASYNGAQNAYNQQLAQRNAMMGGLFGMGASAIPAAAYFFKPSDRRLKTAVRRIGEVARGIGLYTWRYLWGETGVGVMADEVRHIPGAVARVGGFDKVNYRKVLEVV
jgi:hypothetical protein